jgi:RNA polymerase sigma-70 factor (ECF subfamily)
MKHLQDAEDALVGGFFRFFTNIAGFEYRGKGSVAGFLKKIIVNECLMRLRADKRLILQEDTWALDVDSGEDVFSGLNAKHIFRLIAEMPDGYRTIFNLYVVEGYSHQQISKELGISESTSKSQLSRAKAHLRQSLQQTDNYYAGR